MKNCPKCNHVIPDDAVFCPVCGANVNGPYAGNSAQTQNNVPPPPYNYHPAPSPYDHTSEFTAQDISEHKVYAMLPYLMGIWGIIIALLAAHNSPYTAFHVRQALKFSVVDTLSLLTAILLLWTILVPVAYVILIVVLFVVRIICFFQICSGKAKEPVIIRSLPFLN